MSTQLEAIYENGVFRPLQSIQLPEHQRVTVTVETDVPVSSSSVDEAHFVLPPERWQAFWDALDAPPRDLPALHKLLTTPSLFDDNGNASGRPGTARSEP